MIAEMLRLAANVHLHSNQHPTTQPFVAANLIMAVHEIQGRITIDSTSNKLLPFSLRTYSPIKVQKLTLNFPC